MVAKLLCKGNQCSNCLNLAKIHMVAKRDSALTLAFSGLNLAKIHMVAKLFVLSRVRMICLNLAKIHMVAKLCSIESRLS